MKIVNLCISNKNKDKFLFIKRNKHPFQGYFGMLGGKIEDGEDIYNAASRELFEESGIISEGEYLGKCIEKIIENKNILFESEIYFFHFIINEDINFYSSFEGDLRWISIKEFSNYRIIPSDPLMIDSFLNKKATATFSIIEKINENYFQKKFKKLEKITKI
ncbi:MAG: NUDIX hydrolase [Candidatus Pacearchaeota archaeon]